MNYMSYIKGDDANGTGMRCTLFVSGCELACKGCHNPESWKLTAGIYYTKEFEDQIIEDLKSDYISGLSISGGNPTHIKNLPTVLNLCERVKRETGKSIWMWTGRTLCEIKDNLEFSKVLGVVDTLITGRFVEEEKDLSLKWKGSSNQRVIHLEKGIPVRFE